MAWKSVLTVGSTIEIPFAADAQNMGSMALSSLLIPTGDHGKVLTMTGDWSLLLPQSSSATARH